MSSIHRLSSDVVNRIAAGEVIQRPANAVKEILENSLDAHANCIRLTITDGGIKLIQIQDNGDGIKKEDLPLVCERFTTSKLCKYEDLLTISSYGFRGEALASISHISHVTIISCTAEQNCAYKGNYVDGKLVAAKPGQSAEPKPVAGTKGTVIMVEDLFYNSVIRKKALRNPNEEYQKIVDIIMKYAVHHPEVSFSCKKHAEKSATVNTQSSVSRLDAIRAVYGQAIARELQEISVVDDNLHFGLEGYISNPNFNIKKAVLILFINSTFSNVCFTLVDRLVESALIKKVVENAYQPFLPKQTHSWCYLSLELPQQNVDVNVHPTKKEVHILNEDKIVEQIQMVIHDKLSNANTSRTFYVQKMMGPTTNEEKHDEIKQFHLVAAKSKDRSDSKSRTLENVLMQSQTSATYAHDDPEQRLTSVATLLSNIDANCDAQLQTLLKDSTFVGCINTHLLAVQHRTGLYLLNLHQVSKEFIYQTTLRKFANFGVYNIDPLPVNDLLKIAVKSNVDNESAEEDTIRYLVNGILMPQAEMLREYFSISLVDSPSGAVIEGIPIIWSNWKPDLTLLPTFLLRLVTHVEYDDEVQTLHAVAQELAEFYCVCAYGSSTSTLHPEFIESNLFPLIKEHLKTPTSMTSCIIQIAELEQLYKQFERC